MLIQTVDNPSSASCHLVIAVFAASVPLFGDDFAASMLHRITAGTKPSRYASP